MTAATATMQAGRLRAGEALGEVLLGWGILSSILYAGADVLAALRYPGYAYAAQTMGELSAVGAPTRMVAVALALAYAVLVIGFGAAVGECARGNRALRTTGILLVAYGLAGIAAPLFPPHARGSPASLADAAHAAVAGMTVLLMLLQLAFGADAAGKRFRWFTVATFVAVLVLGVLAAFHGPRLRAGEATPWVGVIERACVGAYLLWVAVLDAVLMRAEATAFSKAHPVTPSAARA